jgi:tetratricopeptide (TPR) repeat protein
VNLREVQPVSFLTLPPLRVPSSRCRRASLQAAFVRPVGLAFVVWLAAMPLLGTPLAWAQPATAKMPVHPDVAAARRLIDDERWYDAFSKLADLTPTLAADDPNRAEAQFLLARALFGLNLYQSALRGFDAVVVPPDHRLYREKMRYYLLIQRAVPGDLATIERLSDAAETVHRKEDLDEIRFLLGQYYYNVGDADRAIKTLSPIKPEAGETYLRARHLLGVIHVVQNVAQPALESFKDVLRFEEQVGNPRYYQQYKDMANLSLGRLFYSIGQYETAGRYYDRVQEGTSAWLDSLFELGWTYFQLGRIDRVLGQLHTLNSPYFEDRYYPEARVLEALIHFRTCRFTETLVSVQRFLRDYKPLKKELDAQLSGQRTDAEFYEYLASLSANKKTLSIQLRRIFNVALKDKRLQRGFASVVLANEEMAGIEKLGRNTTAQKPAAELKEDMGRVRAVMIAEAGGLARARLTRVREDLTEIIRQGLRIKYETLKARRGSISDTVRKDMAETAKAVSEPRAEDDEHVVWPFDGSYWKDELGGYTYDTRSRCSAAQMPKGKGSASDKATPGKSDVSPQDKPAAEGK